MTDWPDEAYAVALASLPGMDPSRLGGMLGQEPAAPGTFFAASTGPPSPRWSPPEVWDDIAAGRLDPVLDRVGSRRKDLLAAAPRWPAIARATDVGDLWARYVRAGVHVDVLGCPGYPPELAFDSHPPFILFRTGSELTLAGRRVAIVGTREATSPGLAFARELGEGLARAGVRVVSGLARGIDALAHQGALAAQAAPPIGVVAGGLDVPYPARNRILWRQVAGAGVLLTEWVLGTRSLGWQFPARNRIIAALAEVVVVVESGRTGGSMHTAQAALDRGRDVLAVPGPVYSPASAGTNALLRDGSGPVTSVEDVLSVIGMTTARPPDRPDLDPIERQILELLGRDPVATDRLIVRSGSRPHEVVAALARLEAAGYVVDAGGAWHRRRR